MKALSRLLHRPSNWHGTLAFLSITHCPHNAPVPAPLDNRERYLAFRRNWLPPLANTWPWEESQGTATTQLRSNAQSSGA